MFYGFRHGEDRLRRSPHGERGLKSLCYRRCERFEGSLPTRGAWIEIPDVQLAKKEQASLPTRGAWIEITKFYREQRDIMGRSPHGERGLKYHPRRREEPEMAVAPHTGSVD